MVLHSHTYPWSELEKVQAALHTRGYAYRIDKHGLTVEWSDDGLTEAMLLAGIAEWVRSDAAAVRARRVLTRKRVRV